MGNTDKDGRIAVACVGGVEYIQRRQVVKILTRKLRLTSMAIPT